VVVNSPGFIDHVRAGGAVDVELVPNGADVSMFDPQSKGENFRQIHELEDKFIALYAGAHGMSNDLGILLSAAQMLEDCSEILFILIGDGKEKPALEAQAKNLGLVNLKFIPPAPKKEMPDVLAAANTCIAILKPIPLYATVYPNKVFDYMAAGRPVVLAMEGVIKKVVESAEAGVAIAPGDPTTLANTIRYLADHPQEGTRMGLRGNAYVPCQNQALQKIYQQRSCVVF
jgi:glycosyltransferase involved in cell wall biosynthesis